MRLVKAEGENVGVFNKRGPSVSRGKSTGKRANTWKWKKTGSCPKKKFENFYTIFRGEEKNVISL